MATVKRLAISVASGEADPRSGDNNDNICPVLEAQEGAVSPKDGQ
jgi:hypothetical protein